MRPSRIWRSKARRIINVASISGRTVQVASSPAHGAAKAGVIQLTRFLAYQLGPDGITECNRADYHAYTAGCGAAQLRPRSNASQRRSHCDALAVPEDRAGNALSRLRRRRQHQRCGVDINGGRVVMMMRRSTRLPWIQSIRWRSANEHLACLASTRRMHARRAQALHRRFRVEAADAARSTRRQRQRQDEPAAPAVDCRAGFRTYRVERQRHPCRARNTVLKSPISDTSMRSKTRLSGLENLLFSARIAGLVCDAASADRALHELGLSDFRHLPCKVLSQGQRRRGACAPAPERGKAAVDTR